jgi:hypothetical protein
VRAAPHPPAKSKECGSALLMVLIFAAVIAIALYREMPVAVFEARRQKEQLLVNRGNEYKQAVKLFVRRLGTFPPTIDALERTNNVRFLRHRFVDPFTQKDDWRLIHAGPGGMLLDSKVARVNSNENGSNGGGTVRGSGPHPVSAASLSSEVGTDSSSKTVVSPIRARPPAIPVTGAANAETANAGATGGEPTTPLLAPGYAEQLTDNSPTAVDAQTGSVAGASNNSNGANSPASPSGNGTPGGQVMGGGIAGVASHAQGPSIKKVNDQGDYSLWEFYYDPSKDLILSMGFGMQNGAPQGAVNINGTGAPGTTAPTPSPSPAGTQQ